MKRSNIILVVLLVSLWLIPIIVWGYYISGIGGDYYTGFGENITSIIIANPNLKAEDISLNLNPASGFPGNGQFQEAHKASYLYYKGKKRYLPEVSLQGDMLLVGEAIGAPSGEKLTLHIRINGLHDVILNGVTIWRK
jgi:hypothetical protein